MLVHEPAWKKRSLYAALVLLGLGLEVAVMLLAVQWDVRFSSGSALLGPVLFVASLAYVYLAAQWLDSRYHIGVGPGMSVTLLAGMVSWLVAVVALMFFCFLFAMAVAGIVITAFRIGSKGF